jgi:N6-L-threonylcarbamoyladenine synthase
LKTAVRYQIAPPGEDLPNAPLTSQQVANLAASFQEAVIDCLVAKSLLALKKTGLHRLCVGGGVAANRRLRERLDQECEQAGYELIVAPPELCTDNAVMGAIALERLSAGCVEHLDLDVAPGLLRDYP